MKHIAPILCAATILVLGAAATVRTSAQPASAPATEASPTNVGPALMGAAVSQDKQDERRPSAEHGKYIVHHVAMCIQCHTPRDGHGQLIEARLLHGDALPIASPYKDIRFAFRAPHIAGLPGYSHDQALRLLTTGIAANGQPPLAPMPPFRMTREDAEDVIAYLSSLE